MALKKAKSDLALKDKENKYRLIFENIQDVYFELSTELNIIEISPSIKSLLGYNRNDVIGLPISKILPMKNFISDVISSVSQNKKVSIKHTEMLNNNNEKINCAVKISAYYGNSDHPLKYIGAVHDITDYILSRNKLEKANNEIRYLLASIKSILIGVTTHDIITHWNNEAESLFSIKAAAILGTKITLSGLNWEWDRIYEGISDSLDKKESIFINELRYSQIKNSNIRDRFMNTKITPVYDEKSNLLGFLISGDDITEARNLRIRSILSQKMESIGQLASGIAHEINTPTQYISDNLQFFKKSFSIFTTLFTQIMTNKEFNKTPQNIIDNINEYFIDNDCDYLLSEIPKAIDQTIEGIKRIAKIVGSMKQFSHPGSNNKVFYSINRIIEDTVTISENEWKYAAHIQTDLDSNIPEILCYPNELSQVFLNMIVNSSHAVAERFKMEQVIQGVIKITTLFISLENSVEIKIADNGIGIPDTDKTKIFDPFFTTKEIGKGTGQGLTISSSIITNMHAGSILFESIPGQGTEFTIRIPILKEIETTGDQNEI